MSAFLGHIHYWLYKKIQLINEREQLILEKTRFAIGDLADEIHSISQDTYGEPIDPSIPLEELIDHDNIHGWLQQQIAVSSIREASFIKDLLDTVNGEASIPLVAAILDAYAVQGKACGEAVQLETMTPEFIYKGLQDFYVNGMPCDGGDQIVAAEGDALAWVGDHRHQVEYWKRAGVDLDFMALAYRTWFQFFVEAASNNQYTFTADESTVPTTYIISEA